jgi:hypothetical protein
METVNKKIHIDQKTKVSLPKGRYQVAKHFYLMWKNMFIS